MRQKIGLNFVHISMIVWKLGCTQSRSQDSTSIINISLISTWSLFYSAQLASTPSWKTRRKTFHSFFFFFFFFLRPWSHACTRFTFTPELTSVNSHPPTGSIRLRFICLILLELTHTSTYFKTYITCNHTLLPRSHVLIITSFILFSLVLKTSFRNIFQGLYNIPMIKTEHISKRIRKLANRSEAWDICVSYFLDFMRPIISVRILIKKYQRLVSGFHNIYTFIWVYMSRSKTRTKVDYTLSRSLERDTEH